MTSIVKSGEDQDSMEMEEGLADPRILGIAYKDDRFSMLLVNVYLPTSNVENRDEQQMYLGRLASIIEDAEEQNVCILGDFNAAPGTAFFTDIQRMCGDRDMVMADVRALPPTSFTHVNQGCLSRTWLDHVLLSPCLFDVMDECSILYNSVSSDHFPLLVDFKVNGLPALTQVRQDNAARIKWDFRDKRKREEYGRVVTELLSGIAIDPVRVCCFQNACLDRGHHDDINAFHEALIECVVRAGQTVFGFYRKRWRQVPGWNEFVREAHSAARESFLERRAGGGLRWGPLAERMRSTRARFKLCLRWCKSHEHQLRAQSLADKLASGDSFNFWRGVRSMNPGSHTLPLRVGHAVGEEGIASMWGDHFKGILNCVRDEESENALRGVSLQGFRSVDHEEMRGVLQSLSSSEALVHTSQVLAVLIVPLLKSKVKDPANSGNYRPIAIATALSKVLEKVVLHRLEAYLYTLDNQFSYKKGLGTEIPPSFLSWEILYRGNSPTVAEVKMELFRSHCYSIYCNSLWSRYKVATMNRLKVCHNDILKRLLGLPRWCSSSLAFARNGVNNLDVIRRHSVFSLRSRVELSTNSIITSVRQSSAYVCGPIQQRWLGLLFVQNVG
ncbi:hypothetical protein GWK47_010600 [Chionoecetes opilio]|uniref:Endonuclease/exonuclease/phosphatase domain-containing protein n=1 Tax=Chionoecetes opilio TaxID=41210 RepID=A0A8J4Y4B6_CHIOP|nr:hypothetical protein GWK47_010600 [Chionoecetes opilio]